LRFPLETRLGPYELVAFIGAGGMGEVYRGRDTRLDRAVAVKVLSPDVATNPEMRQRFEREARAISALSHPHICRLFDIGHHDGVEFLVMEYLEGETLAQRLIRGALPVDQMLRYSIEIAEALDSAHRQGVVHRDLKPGNIVLTASGAKLLDFGLAKLQPVLSKKTTDESSTVPVGALTTAGMIVGTLTYMAPEQLEAGTIDARTDIFAFGAVMYEMVTGKRAFEARSQASAIAAVISSMPAPPAALQPGVPPALDRAITTCLAKDPNDRWQTARDLLRELRWIQQGATTVISGQAVSDLRRRRRWVPWVISAGSVVLLVAAGIAEYLRVPTRDSALVRFTVSPPEGMSIGRGTSGEAQYEANAPVLAPDGKQLAYVAADREGRTQLFLRRFDEVESTVVAGTEGARRPFWSPDSRFVAFFADGKLKKIDTRGGRPQTIADAPRPYGGTWNSAGVILFAASPREGLHRVADTGGVPTKVTSMDPGRRENGHILPSFLPDGEHFLYVVLSDDLKARGVYVGSLDGRPAVQVLNGRYKTTYAEPGYLLYVRDGTLFAQAFDSQTRQLAGPPPQPLIDAVPPGAFSVSPSGVLAFHPMNDPQSQLVWFDRHGNETRRIEHSIDNHPIELSPDDRRVAVIRNDPQTESRRQDIWLIDLARDIVSRLTAHPADDCCPVWSPDGREIVFSSDREGMMSLFRAPASGPGGERLLLKGDSAMSAKDWSGDGSQLLLSINDDLWLLSLVGDRKLRPFVQSSAKESDGDFSPDGRWVAYVSNDSGRMEVYCASVNPPHEKWQLSTAGGYQPRWRADGREVYYVTADSKLMAVGITTTGTLEVQRPRELFRTRLSLPLDNPFMTRYDVSSDGRFLLNVPMQPRESPLIVVLNWHADLRARQ
jgi:serine/threonine protein kinase/Tol biopolymer transport system component